MCGIYSVVEHNYQDDIKINTLALIIFCLNIRKPPMHPNPPISPTRPGDCTQERSPQYREFKAQRNRRKNGGGLGGPRLPRNYQSKYQSISWNVDLEEVGRALGGMYSINRFFEDWTCTFNKG